MLEFLKLKIDGLGLGESSISIWNKNGKLRFTYGRGLFEPDPPAIVKVPMRVSKAFLSRIEKLEIEKWKELYLPKDYTEKKNHIPVVCNWSLVYKEEGRDILQSGGRNAYPENWDEFFMAVSTLSSERGSVHLNRIASLRMEFRYNLQVLSFNPLTMEKEESFLEYFEDVSIDRFSMKMIYRQIIANKNRVKHEYYLPDMIDYLLANAESYLKNIDGGDFEKAEDDAPRIKMIINWRDGSISTFTRAYIRSALPSDWNEFIEDIHDILEFYGIFGSIFDKNFYEHGVKKGENIYLLVSVVGYKKPYYYRTYDDNLIPGDMVLVPVGKKNSPVRGVIKDVEYYKDDEVPYPLDKTKFIIASYKVSGDIGEIGNGGIGLLGGSGKNDN